MPALAIRSDLPPEALRRLAKLEPDARVARRLLAMANALDGMDRATAAKLARNGPPDVARLGDPLQ